MSTYVRLVKLMRDHLLSEVDAITPQSRLIGDLKLDSMDRYDIACQVLDEFGVDIPDDKMMGARTVADVVALIDEEIAALPVRGMA